METYDQCPSPPQKEGGWAPSQWTRVFSLLYHHPLPPLLPPPKPGSRNQSAQGLEPPGEGHWWQRLPTTKHLSYEPESSAISGRGRELFSFSPRLMSKVGAGGEVLGNAGAAILPTTAPHRTWATWTTAHTTLTSPSSPAPTHQQGLLAVPLKSSHFSPLLWELLLSTPLGCSASTKPLASLAGPQPPPAGLLAPSSLP